MTTMKALLFLALATTALGQTPPVRTIAVGPRPESVTRGFDGKLFVTVMNSDNTPGDAVVKVVDGDEVAVFATGMDEPKGITFAADHLVTTDVTRVWKIDATGKATILAAADAFPHPPSYLNDAAAAPDGKAVFITDMGDKNGMFGPDGLWPLDSPEARRIKWSARVYRIEPDGKVSIAIDTDPAMLNPNGVTAPEPGLLLVAEFFMGNILSHSGGKMTTLNTGFRGADAIERDSQGNLYISSWTQGKVWKLGPKGQNPKIIAQGLKSAADFLLDEKQGVIIVPDMLAGTLNYYSL